MTNQVDILIFVEDPGATNMALDLPAKLVDRGYQATLLAANHAIDYLSVRHLTFQAVTNDVDAGFLLDHFMPKLLSVGTSENPDSIGLALIDEARMRNIPVVAMVDMACNAERRFRGRGDIALTHAPDRLIVSDAITQDAFVALGFPLEHIALLGHPQYDMAWRRRRELEQAGLRAPRVSPRWVFVAEGFDQLNPAASYRTPEYTLMGRGDTDWRTGIVLEEILDGIAALQPRPDIVVRLHPKSMRQDFNQWVNDISFDDGTDPLACIWDADVVLGMSSMLLVEAAILGRPVLSILPRQSESQWLGPLAMKYVASVWDRKSLRSTLGHLHRGAAPGVPAAEWAAPNAGDNIADYLALTART